MTRDELLSKMSSEEFIEWVVFYTLEAKEAERQRRIAEQRAKMHR